MKKNKAIVSIIVIIAMFAMTVAPTYAYSGTINNEEFAIEASQILLSAFSDANSNSGYTYPDNFGGLYIQDNMLHIQMASSLASDYRFYQDLLSDYTAYIVFDDVDHSYNRLTEACQDMVDCLCEDFTITSYYVDERNNEGVVTIAENPDEVPQAMSFLFNDVSQMVRLEQQDRVNLCSSVYGGETVYSDSHGYTLGLAGTYYNSLASSYTNAFIMCGHGLSLGESIYCSNQRIGKVKKLQFSDGGYGDYAIIGDVPSNVTPSTGIVFSSNFPMPVTGAVSNPVVGTQVRGFGKDYSQMTGVVTARNVAFSGGNYPDVEVLGTTMVKMNYNRVEEGDSGGPWCVYGDNILSFCGVTTGSSIGKDIDTGKTTYYSYFTPYYYFSGYFIPKLS